MKQKNNDERKRDKENKKRRKETHEMMTMTIMIQLVEIYIGRIQSLRKVKCVTTKPRPNPPTQKEQIITTRSIEITLVI